MNTERMKFAWARGATIQRKLQGDVWANIRCPIWDWDPQHLRLRPQDDHLEYGPISGPLLDLVLYGFDMVNHPERDAGESAALYLIRLPRKEEHDIFDPVEYRMYLLFAAEYLADKGL